VDLGLYLRVLWRFKLLMLVGLVLALGLSFLSYARVSFAGGSPKITYLQSEVWQSEATILVTQPGFPWGRASNRIIPQKVGEVVSGVPQFADETRFSSLAAIYTRFVMSDRVKAMVLRGVRLGDGTVHAWISGSSVIAGIPSAEPMVTVAGRSTSPAVAKETAVAATKAIRDFIESQQDAAQIPADQRVLLEVINQPTEPIVFEPRKKTRPIVVFLVVLLVFQGLALILENARPRVRVVPDAPAEPAAASPPIRRSA
jgi:hypothetical protein